MMTGIFGDELLSDLVLLVQWVVFLGLLYSWFLARKKNFTLHKQLITALFTIQVLTSLYMVYRLFQLDIQPILLIHGLFGFVAFLVILYTILFMHRKLPSSLEIPKVRQKLLMQVAAVLWLVLTFSGSFVFVTLYF